MTEWWEKIDVKTLVGAHYTDVRFHGSWLNGVVFKASQRFTKGLMAIKMINVRKKDRTARVRLDYLMLIMLFYTYSIQRMTWGQHFISHK